MRWARLLFVVAFFSMLHAQDIPKQTERTVFLTHRNLWLASGGFNPNNQTKPHNALPALPDYVKDFRKECSKVTVTDMQARADYAVTIDESFRWCSLFQVAVYSRNAGFIYVGETVLLKNAIKDACNAIGTTK